MSLEMIGLIVQSCTTSFKSGHYMVFPGIVVSCEIPVHTVSLQWDCFTAAEERGEWNRQKVVRCGAESILYFFNFIFCYKGHCLGTHCVLLSQGIVLRSHFRVKFPSLDLVLLYQKAEVKTSPLSGIWLLSMSHFYNVPASPVGMFLF